MARTGLQGRRTSEQGNNMLISRGFVCRIEGYSGAVELAEIYLKIHDKTIIVAEAAFHVRQL